LEVRESVTMAAASCSPTIAITPTATQNPASRVRLPPRRSDLVVYRK
jgi:hypothetical protein